MATINELEQAIKPVVVRRRHIPLSLLGWRIAGYLTLIVAVLIIGLPVYWTVMASFKETREIYSLPVTWWPAKPTFNNFSAAWEAAPSDDIT